MLFPASPSAKTCNFHRTPAVVESRIYTIKRHSCSKGQRHVHREAISCCFSLGTILFPGCTVHSYSHTCYRLCTRGGYNDTKDIVSCESHTRAYCYVGGSLFHRTPPAVTSIIYTIKRHSYLRKQMHIHREATSCHFSVGAVPFSDCIVHFYSYMP